MNNVLHWEIFWIEFCREMNKCIIFWIVICHFWRKAPLFVYFWHFTGTFPIWLVSMMPWLLNWIIFWIESAEFILNWIIFWIGFWVKQYWMEYWMNHFFGKIQKLNWIRLGIGHHYAWISKWWYVWWSPADIYLQETSKIAGKLPSCPSRPPCPLRQGLKERRMISEASRYKLAHRLNIIHTKGYV